MLSRGLLALEAAADLSDAGECAALSPLLFVVKVEKHPLHHSRDILKFCVGAV